MDNSQTIAGWGVLAYFMVALLFAIVAWVCEAEHIRHAGRSPLDVFCALLIWWPAVLFVMLHECRKGVSQRERRS
jgi:hypothetical protein